jgi:hypothetical protein
MEQIYIKDFVGQYHRTGKTPNHFVSNDTGIELLIKTRDVTHTTLPPHYLLYRRTQDSKFTFLSSLWRISEKNEFFKISGTQKDYAKVKLDLFQISITR